jgi:SPP1 family predicted phage head-tail adaptor
MSAVISMPIGRLSHRLTLERGSRGNDGGGGAPVAWEVEADMWGAVEDMSGSERVRGDRVTGEANALITVRYRDDIVPAMRFRNGRAVYSILAVLDGDGQRRFLRCQCQRRDL